MLDNLLTVDAELRDADKKALSQLNGKKASNMKLLIGLLSDGKLCTAYASV
jgi:hypothetical protein